MGGSIPRDRDTRIDKLEIICKQLSESGGDRIIDLIDQDVEDVFDDMVDYVSENIGKFKKKASNPNAVVR